MSASTAWSAPIESALTRPSKNSVAALCRVNAIAESNTERNHGSRAFSQRAFNISKASTECVAAIARAASPQRYLRRKETAHPRQREFTLNPQHACIACAENLRLFAAIPARAAVTEEKPQMNRSARQRGRHRRELTCLCPPADRANVAATRLQEQLGTATTRAHTFRAARRQCPSVRPMCLPTARGCTPRKNGAGSCSSNAARARLSEFFAQHCGSRFSASSKKRSKAASRSGSRASRRRCAAISAAFATM